MAQYIDKELIKQEIESYKESVKGLEPHSDFRRGQLTAYNQIMQFIDSLPKKPESDDLEDEIENYIKDSLAIKFPTTDKELIKSDIKYIAHHFAEWQREKDQEILKFTEESDDLRKGVVKAIANKYKE